MNNQTLSSESKLDKSGRVYRTAKLQWKLRLAEWKMSIAVKLVKTANAIAPQELLEGKIMSDDLETALYHYKDLTDKINGE